MDPINILTGIVLVLSLAGNFSATGKTYKSKGRKILEKPKTWLQRTPMNISALVILLEILGIFSVGVFNIENNEYLWLRLAGLAVFVIFSWLQIQSFKTLGSAYTQDIILYKDHEIIRKGLYSRIRHPQYMSQVLADIGAGIALLSWLVLPVAILIELPLFYMRAKKEEEAFMNHFPEDYREYKKKSGFMLPFIG